ncbi:MMPL family transporter [Phytoactinopolyspora sp. XMNu-373]|uniref:MMPL family transporter n=2 Tax=Phytoactinopolyspora mesophila TaxID=2650750 RepID=A0A7K3LXI1_9ACTN|nr:MMPL family transporter [Phytoactinopolyspora mesophila]
MRRHRAARWLLPALVALVWIALGGLLGPYTGKLGDVQTNDNAAFLPSDAESTQVWRLQQEIAGQDSVPAIIVVEYNDAEADGADLETFTADVLSLPGVVGIPGPAVPSADGEAAQIVVQIDGARDADAGAVVEEIRAAAGQVSGDVYVTGPAGFAADLGEAFGDIDGLLLWVAVSAVLVILLVVYRSPLLPFIVLTSALLALSAAAAAVYWLADRELLTLNGQSQGIMFILVVGAATDYALLLVSRFREELREQGSRFAAMRAAIRGALPAIVASGGTVILGVLCLLVSELNSNRDLGPVAAIGIAMSMAASLTFLPAMLLLLGRAAFWPFRPRHGSSAPERSGAWSRVASLVARRSRPVWIATALGLAMLAVFVPRLDADGVAQTDLFQTDVESVAGQEVLARHFPGGSGNPVTVAGPQDDIERMIAVMEADPGITDADVLADGAPGGDESSPAVSDGQVIVLGTLGDAPDSDGAKDTVQRLRADLAETVPEALVGGETAVQVDTDAASVRDRQLIIPLVLAVVFVVLAILLRALIAPAVLLLANVLSFFATLGVAALVFEFVFGFDGIDPAVPLFGFVFLIALGIDYSIFLTTRVREEAGAIGTRPGISRGLTVTGGVITSAGVVLAATFSALAVVPISFLIQIAFIVAFGVLLDTFVVRSLLVPALAYDIGSRVWWPGHRVEKEELSP